MSDKRGGVTQVIDVSVPEEINHLRGQKVDTLNNPQGSVRTLYLECEAGEYRIRVGNISDGIPSPPIIIDLNGHCKPIVNKWFVFENEAGEKFGEGFSNKLC